MVSRTALFVIDIQAELASDPNTAIPHAARIRAAGSALLARARGVVDASNPSDLEIVIVQHAEDPQGTEATLIAGSKAWELLFPPRAESKDERLVAKTTADTFESNPTLAQELKDRGVERIVAGGIQSDYCVRATCRGAVNAGFKVVLLQGAHSTYDDTERGKPAEEVEREIEEELRAIGVDIVPWEQWTF